MNIVRVHQCGDGVLLTCAAQHEPLFLGQVLPRAPLGHMERDVPVGLPDLLPVGPACGSMLAIANRFGLDVIQIPASGEVRGGGDEQKHPARQ